jgi:hypothetical protein
LNSCVALLQNPLASAVFMAVITGVKYRREIQLAQARLQNTLARLAALPDYKRQFAVRARRDRSGAHPKERHGFAGCAQYVEPGGQLVVSVYCYCLLVTIQARWIAGNGAEQQCPA